MRNRIWNLEDVRETISLFLQFTVMLYRCCQLCACVWNQFYKNGVCVCVTHAQLSASEVNKTHKPGGKVLKSV